MYSSTRRLPLRLCQTHQEVDAGCRCGKALGAGRVVYDRLCHRAPIAGTVQLLRRPLGENGTIGASRGRPPSRTRREACHGPIATRYAAVEKIGAVEPPVIQGPAEHRQDLDIGQCEEKREQRQADVGPRDESLRSIISAGQPEQGQARNEPGGREGIGRPEPYRPDEFVRRCPIVARALICGRTASSSERSEPLGLEMICIALLCRRLRRQDPR
jgi:hypothetical protein